MVSLTPRQAEVLSLVQAGKTSKEIALQLGVKVRTIAEHRENLRRIIGPYYRTAK